MASRWAFRRNNHNPSHSSNKSSALSSLVPDGGASSSSSSSSLLHRQQQQQQQRSWCGSRSGGSSSSSSGGGRGSGGSGSSLMVTNARMWCVFVMWMLLLSACDRSGLVSMSAASESSSSSSSSSASSSGDGESATTSNPPQCVLKGRVYTERLWYGYLFDKAFHRDYAKIQYTISYPVKECCTNLLIYYDDQIKQLKQDMSCEERAKVLPFDNNQVIPLHTLNKTVGCRVWNDSDESYYVCIGERIFRSSGPRTWYFALSRCQAKTPLTLNYAFNISGYYGDCEEDPLVRTYVPPSPKEDSNLSIALGVVAGVAGVAVIAAVVFFVLWFLARRSAANSKGSSVTSSQATMTQDDIFYVNPSLSDREQAEYGTSQASSENYYEVIPERRSYESINPHLLAAGGGGPGGMVGGAGSHHHHPLVHGPPHLAHHLHPMHAHGHGTHPRQIHLHGPAAAAAAAAAAAHQGSGQLKESAFHRPQPGGVGYPMFEDYPPPPYQPPRLLGGPRHHTLHHPTPHHHHHALSLPPTAARPRPPLLSPTPMAGLSPFPPSVLPPAPAPSSSVPASSSASSTTTNAAAAIINNNTASGNNNNGNNSNNNVLAGAGATTSAITMNTTTNTVSLGETTA